MTDIKFDVVSNDILTPLGVEIWVDNQCILDCNHIREKIQFSHQLSDSDAKHDLIIVLKNKQSQHTQIDQQGNIIKDATITVDNILFDSVECTELFYKLSQYSHNFNGNSAAVTENFFGTMGCNGNVRLTFETPVYLWLLEHM